MYDVIVMTAIIRTDKWKLRSSPEQVKMIDATIQEYRHLVRALMGVVFTHWPEISRQDSQHKTLSVEKLIHQTAKNTAPRYAYFNRRFYKFPSYLRRAAINAAVGQVSSFISRYDLWQTGDRKNQHARPPCMNGITEIYPPLYRGQCIKFNADFGRAEIKLWNGSDWIWSSMIITGKRQRHKIANSKQMSPTLILKNGRAILSVPFKIDVPRIPLGDTVCAVDVGINTTATVSIIRKDGTVAARRFIHPASDIDRRDVKLKRISMKARRTAKLSKGFCSNLYRKVASINNQISHVVSKAIVQFALEHQCAVIVFEHLKGWRPTAGRKRSGLRQKFHGWLHRMLVLFTQQKFQEHGGQTSFVYARGTSSYAYDGSGKLTRNKANHALATFSNGKQYNADLNASYNIGARFWFRKLNGRNDREADQDKSSQSAHRTPVTLSSLWVIPAHGCGA